MGRAALTIALAWGMLITCQSRELLDVIWPDKQKSRDADKDLKFIMPDIPFHNHRVKVPGIVKYGQEPGNVEATVIGEKDLVYKYVYGKDVGGRTYQASCDKYGWSEERSFKVPGDVDQLPISIGLIGDLGQTLNSSATLKHLRHHHPDLVWHVGDSSYADNYCSDASETYCKLSSDQRRWDTWARLTERLFSRVPIMHIHGNHDREMQTNHNYRTFAAINARYPVPTDPRVINTSPNYAATYLDVHGLKPERFVNEAKVQPNNSYYSQRLPGTHFIVLSTYLPYGRHSKQYAWFQAELSKVDRSRTPWLILMFHASARNNYAVHFKEVEEFMQLFEPLFYQHQVDMIFNGHTHAYEFTYPMLNYTVNPCGPMYICIGDGGNMEGLARFFIDEYPPPYCDNPGKFAPPIYQPSPSGKAVLTFQDGKFCPESQPKWSLMRDPSFGHGMLTLHNATHAEWKWYRNQDGEAKSAHHVYIERTDKCSPERPKRLHTVHAALNQQPLAEQRR
ncbi:hypothetical protein N2152v2_001715 [Parachlorella kessleri]